MKYKRTIGSLVLVGMLVLSGCSENKSAKVEDISNQKTESSKNTGNTAQMKGKDIPQKYEKSCDNIQFNTEIICPDEVRNKPLYKEKSIKNEYSEEKIRNVLEVTTEDFSVSSYGVTYCTQLGEHIMGCVDLDSRGGNLDVYRKNEDLEFCTKDEAVNDVLQTIKDMGISLGEVSTVVYAMDHETLKSQENKDGLEENIPYMRDNWSKDDDAYFIGIRQMVQGVEEYHPNADVFKNDGDDNMPITVIYSKDGIESLDIERTFTFEQTGEEMELASIESIFDTIEREYTQLITDSKFNVSSAKFYYKTPTMGKDMRPVWLIHMQEVTADGTVYEIVSVYDAQTGKEIVMEGTSA